MTLKTLVLIIVSLVAGVASAQSSNSSATSEARVHFERAVELYREGSFDAALAEFERSHQIAPNYKILYNLAQVQAERHQYVAAIKLLTEYMQVGGNEISAERRQAVAEDMQKLRQRIVALTIDVSVAGAEVFVNDVSVGRSPLPEPVLVNVGTCRVRAEKVGYGSDVQTLTVAGTDRRRIELKLAQAATLVQQPQPAPATTTVTTRNLTPFWVSLGATVVLGGTTAVFGVLTHSANDDLDHALDQFPAKPETVDGARQKVKTMATLTDAFGAATIVAAGVGVYFLISPPEDTEVVPATGVHARISPTPNGLAVSGVF